MSNISIECAHCGSQDRKGVPYGEGGSATVCAECGRSEMIVMSSSMDVECMSLQQVQAEPKEITGTPLRSDDDRSRRQQLWKRLDRLVAIEPPLF
jgi:hypothetical protein